MSKIQEALNKISAVKVTPISYEGFKPTAEPEPKKTVADVDLQKVDWNQFAIDGVRVVDLLVRAINTLIIKYYKDPKSDGTDGLKFNLSDLYEIAGIDDVDETYESIKGKEEELAKLIDEDGFGWRYYCTKAAFEKFESEANWDVEIYDNGLDRKFIASKVEDLSKLITDPLGYFGYKFLTGLSILKEGFSEEDKEAMTNLAFEKVLGSYTVVMTEAEPVEVEYEDEDEDKVSIAGDSCTTKAEDKPETTCRTTKPQMVTDLNELLKAIGIKI